ncbi:MAG: hypothetical protein IPO40_24335 [Fibrobacteres bacterium]|nr:hypothetical protein [Fibrobacterota bacterium]
MALGKEKEGGNYITFKPSIGRLTIKSDQGDPEAKPRTYKDSKTNQDVTVYEQRYQYITGKVVGVEVDTTGEYGSQLKIVLRDGETDYTLPVPLNKSWGTKVAEAMPNIKLDEDVTITAYADFVADGKDVQAGLSLKQGGARVTSHFNYKENEALVRAEGFPEYPQADTILTRKEPCKYTKFWGRLLLHRRGVLD